MESKLFGIILLLSFCGYLVFAAPDQSKNVTEVQNSHSTLAPPTTVGNSSEAKIVEPKNLNNNSAPETKTTSNITNAPKTQETPSIASTQAVDHPTTSIPATSENKTAGTKISEKATTPTPQITTHIENNNETTTIGYSTKSSDPNVTELTTIKPTLYEMRKDRSFDGPSFIGGIVLALGLTGIGFVAYKFCKSKTGRNYRNF